VITFTSRRQQASLTCFHAIKHFFPLRGFVYYISVPFLYLISLLPFPVLYGVSNGLYGILFYVLGYRKTVVLNNLHNAFPEQTEAERLRICKAFYRHLCDLFLETFKTLTISPQAMLRRCRFRPEALELFRDLERRQQSVILMMGHQGNWEWGGNLFSLEAGHQLYVIYHPLSNPYFNALIIRMRTRFKTRLIAMKDTFREMIAHRKDLNATAFIADQSPRPESAYWTQFLAGAALL
jgi:KDO2-lipid IV(A) lauroyltransferase